jgi:hypothetical protein
VHANQYYSLDVSHFKSSLDTKVLDLLWNKYWVATLSQSPLNIVNPRVLPVFPVDYIFIFIFIFIFLLLFCVWVGGTDFW